MPTNPYFRDSFSSPSDQLLVQNLNNEVLFNKGRDIQYIPRNLIAFDTLYWEDKISEFNNFYTIEVYIENFLGFGGQREFISKFGYEIRDEITLIVSKSRFNDVIVGPANDPHLLRPREGDLVYFPLDKSLFEITFCDNKETFYALGRLYNYRLFCKRFELAAESFNTGIDKIDNLPKDFGITTSIEVQTPGQLVNITLVLVNIGTESVTLLPGEIVYQGSSYATSTWSATVLSFNTTTNELIVNMVKGDITPTKVLRGVDSNSSWALVPNFEQVLTEPNFETTKFEQNTTFDYFDSQGPVVDSTSTSDNPLTS